MSQRTIAVQWQYIKSRTFNQALTFKEFWNCHWADARSPWFPVQALPVAVPSSILEVDPLVWYSPTDTINSTRGLPGTLYYISVQYFSAMSEPSCSRQAASAQRRPRCYQSHYQLEYLNPEGLNLFTLHLLQIRFKAVPSTHQLSRIAECTISNWTCPRRRVIHIDH